MSRSIKASPIEHLRQEYRSHPLTKKKLKPDPFNQFKLWFNEAMKSEILEPNAMVLATASATGIPSSRTVLLKHIDASGFVFYTNYESRKARQLAENPHASLTFLWKELERQINVEGIVEKTSEEDSATYFAKRPIKSQISAWASKQSSILTDRAELEEAYQHYLNMYKDKNIPLPPFWGGYRIIPSRFEFWQGRPSRLHDRFQYILQGDGRWHIDRLAP